jgi:hypothetical protein
MADNSTETPSEGHDKVRKKIDIYKTAVDVNEKQKELKKKKKETNTTVDEYEGKFKKKIETYTQKAKDKPKQFKEAARNQLSQLIETFKMSASDGEDPSSNSETETVDVQKLKSEVAELDAKLIVAKKDKNTGNVKLYQEQIDELNKEINKANFGQLKTDSAKNATEALRNTFIQTVNRTKERLQEVLFNETVSALGCSQEQNYETTKPLYIKVSSIDVFGKTLQTDPNISPGQYIYEVKPFSPRKQPYSFNRELYHRLQNPGKSYKDEYNVNFLGATAQELFNITYVKDPIPIPNEPPLYGDYYKVELSPRVSGEKVVDFLNDYFNSIDILNFNELYSNVLNLLTGSINIKLKTGEDNLRSQTEFEKILQRILGLCFDNRQEIDVSGSGKLDPLDQIDDSFFVLSPQEMVEVENKVKNVLESVVQYRDCGTLLLPVNADANLSLLDKFLNPDVNASNADRIAQDLLDELSKNPEWKLLFPQLDVPDKLKDIINTNFLELIPIAIFNSLLSPKHLFPLMVMAKALQNKFVDDIETLQDFLREFRRFIINLQSKISGIFVEELVKQIRKNIKDLMQTIVQQTTNELLNKKAKIILASINLALTLATAITDYRRCKSIIDELQRMLSLTSQVRTLAGNSVPPLINYLATLKPGMSATSLLTRQIDKLEEVGVPTGDLPDGTPNLSLIIQQSNNQSLIDEIAENGKTVVTITGIEVADLSSKGFTTVPGNLF